MVDIEADVYDRVARAVLAEYPSAFTSSTYVPAPSSFPAVSLAEISSVTNTSSLDSRGRELMSDLTFEVNVCTNLKVGAKEQARDIARIVDGVMLPMNMTRTYSSQVTNSADSSVYRHTTRYVCTAGEDGRIYRR